MGVSGCSSYCNGLIFAVRGIVGQSKMFKSKIRYRHNFTAALFKETLFFLVKAVCGVVVVGFNISYNRVSP